MEQKPANRRKITVVCVPVSLEPLPPLPSKSGRCADCGEELWIEHSTTESLTHDYAHLEPVFVCPVCVMASAQAAGKLDAIAIVPTTERQRADLAQIVARAEGRGNN